MTEILFFSTMFFMLINIFRKRSVLSLVASVTAITISLIPVLFQYAKRYQSPWGIYIGYLIIVTVVCFNLVFMIMIKKAFEQGGGHKLEKLRD